MNWYYAVDGRQLGPVNQAAFQDLVGQGVIKPDTLVWREGMANWLPYSQIGGTSPLPSMPTGEGASGDPNQIRYCTQCGRGYPASQLQTIGAATVCASCRPAHMSGMAAGASYGAPGSGYGVPGAMPYAPALRFGGFWIRFLARIIDGIIVGIGQLILLIPFLLTMGFNQRVDYGDVATVVTAFGLAGISFAAGVAYEAYFLSTRGATPGKIALGLQVIRPTGEFLTPARSVGRYFGTILSQWTLDIGYIIAGFDSEKRALHDHLCDTRVVYKS